MGCFLSAILIMTPKCFLLEIWQCDFFVKIGVLLTTPVQKDMWCWIFKITDGRDLTLMHCLP